MYKTAVHALAVKKGIMFDQVFQINGYITVELSPALVAQFGRAPTI